MSSGGYHGSIQTTITGGGKNFKLACDRLRRQWGDTFVAPKPTEDQLRYFNTSIRVEVVSPSGYRRRGYIHMTSGYRPALMLIHRHGSAGSWDLLTENDVVVGAVDERGRLHEVPHDKLQVAVYTGEAR